MATWREKWKNVESQETSNFHDDFDEGDSHNAVTEPQTTNRPEIQRTVAAIESTIGNYRDFAGIGIGFASVIGETVLSHPCIVIRRQCQIRHDSLSYHLTPFTVIPIVFRIARHQGFGTLWKGLGSVFMVRGLGLLSETVISEFTPLPKEVTRHSSLKKLAQHVLLKALSWVVIAPFYATSLVEVVQSDIASEPPGILNCLKEGLSRLTLIGQSATRLLPVWRFVPPVVLLGVSQYVIKGVVALTTQQCLRGDDVDELETSPEAAEVEDVYEQYYCDLVSSFTSSLVADVMCYPLETVVQRLCIQGTRTIIDNTDTGLEVAPVTTAYNHLADAIRSIATEEGGAGFFKGFGALVLQYSIQFLLLKLVKLCYEQLLISSSDSDSHVRRRSRKRRGLTGR